MSLANRCHVCEIMPAWRIIRVGDAVITWACEPHLSEIVTMLQRDHEITEVVVSDFRKAAEWGEIRRILDKAAEGEK